MMSVEEVKRWINTLDGKNYVAIDDGGLCLVELTPDDQETGAYCEIGGIPLPDDEAKDAGDQMMSAAWLMFGPLAREDRKFGPKSPDHPSIGMACRICRKPFKAGDFTTLAPGAPASVEDMEKKNRGDSYTASATEVHWDCAKQVEASRG